MKQIYINTMFGTTRIDYDEQAKGDIIIVASPGTNVETVTREHIECLGIEPHTITTFRNPDRSHHPIWEEEKRHALYGDEGETEKYLRDLFGDDGYEAYEAQW